MERERNGNSMGRRVALAVLAGGLLASAVPGLAAAMPGECGPGGVGPIVVIAVHEVGGPMGGPNERWGWAHPDGKTANPGQAIQFFCK